MLKHYLDQERFEIPPSILLASNDWWFTEGIRGILQSSQSESMITETGTLPDLHARIREAEKVELIVIDLAIPDLCELDGLTKLRSQFPKVPILVLGDWTARADALKVLQTGADIYLPKSVARDVIVNAVRFILSGGMYVPQTFLAQTREQNELGEETTSAPVESLLGLLTPRERSVLTLLAKGLTNAQIARELGIRPSTAVIHVKNLRHKLRAVNRTHAVAIGQKLQEKVPRGKLP